MALATCFATLFSQQMRCFQVTQFFSRDMLHDKLTTVVVTVNLYLTRVILSEYLKGYLLSIGTLIKLIYKYHKS